jgi:hypothetical protein
MELLRTILDSTEDTLICPHCHAQTIQCRFLVGAGRHGWGAIWCDTCSHGVHLSKVIVPVGIDAEPISPSNAIPRFEVVTPMAEDLREFEGL